MGLLVYCGINLSIFLRTDDVRIPVVLTLLTGGAIIPQVAARSVAIVALSLLLTGAGVLILLTIATEGDLTLTNTLRL